MKKFILIVSIILAPNFIQAFGFSSIKKKFKSATNKISKAASSVVNKVLKIEVFNFSGTAINVEYVKIGVMKDVSSEIPRITQADWFDATKTVTWDLKPELYSTSSKGKIVVRKIAYFPGDFYVRTDLTTSK